MIALLLFVEVRISDELRDDAAGVALDGVPVVVVVVVVVGDVVEEEVGTCSTPSLWDILSLDFRPFIPPKMPLFLLPDFPTLYMKER